MNEQDYWKAKILKPLNNFAKRSLSKINFNNNSFDIIYAHLSLHYFTDKITTKIFNKLYTILKPNGIIFIKYKSVKDTLYGQGEKICIKKIIFAISLVKII